MVSIQEAKSLIKANTRQLETCLIHTADALGYVLGEDVFAPINLPGFRQSAMDGYALFAPNGIAVGDTRLLGGEIQAGDTLKHKIGDNEAWRIFTGAPVPDGADTVVIQEMVTRHDGHIEMNGTLKTGANIRVIGEQISKGQLALPKGSVIKPAAIGYLLSLGVSVLNVYRKPRISIVVTGNELIAVGQELKFGQIYESNAMTMKAILQEHGFGVTEILKVSDDFNATRDTLEKALLSVDVLLVSGGISVGDYDFVGKALNDIGVETVFYKINQKPGKPMYYGKKSDHAVFALPGNPASAMVCLLAYTLPALRQMMGRNFEELEKRFLPLQKAYQKRGARPEFLKAIASNTHVEILDGQSSFMLHSFAQANALVFIPEDAVDIAAGDLLECYML